MRVTIGQINTTNGDYEGNVAQCLRAIEQARRDGSDLVVLPEVAVQGYMSFDWFLDRDVVEHALEPLDQIIAASVTQQASRSLTETASHTGRRSETSANDASSR